MLPLHRADSPSRSGPRPIGAHEKHHETSERARALTSPLERTWWTCWIHSRVRCICRQVQLGPGIMARCVAAETRGAYARQAAPTRHTRPCRAPCLLPGGSLSGAQLLYPRKASRSLPQKHHKRWFLVARRLLLPSAVASGANSLLISPQVAPGATNRAHLTRPQTRC